MVSVALGSTLATVLLNADVSMSEGIVALTLLVALQYLVTWSSVRCRFIKRLARAEPTLIYRDGFLDAAMRRQRVTHEEVRQAARTKGHASLDQVSAVVLETDGSLSIMTAAPSQGAAAG